MTSCTKNRKYITYRNDARGEPSQGIANLVKSGCVAFELPADRYICKTGRQNKTYTLSTSHYFAPLDDKAVISVGTRNMFVQRISALL